MAQMDIEDINPEVEDVKECVKSTQQVGPRPRLQSTQLMDEGLLSPLQPTTADKLHYDDFGNGMSKTWFEEMQHFDDGQNNEDRCIAEE